MDPSTIMAIVVSLIILGVGVFAYFTVTSSTTEVGNQQGAFQTTYNQTVTNPAAAQTISVGIGLSSNQIAAPKYFNGLTWVTASAGDYSYDSTTGIITTTAPSGW